MEEITQNNPPNITEIVPEHKDLENPRKKLYLKLYIIVSMLLLLIGVTYAHYHRATTVNSSLPKATVSATPTTNSTLSTGANMSPNNPNYTSGASIDNSLNSLSTSINNVDSGLSQNSSNSNGF